MLFSKVHGFPLDAKAFGYIPVSLVYIKAKQTCKNVSFGWDFPDDGIVKAI